jgi:hypothetical protein
MSPYWVAVLLGIALSPSAAIAGVADHRAWPPCPSRALAPSLGGHTRVVRVEVPISKDGTIRGVDPSDSQPALVRVCRTAEIDDLTAPIKPGDLAWVFEARSRSGMVATRVSVNVYTAYVRIAAVHGHRIAVVVVDPRSLKPIPALYPRYLGPLATEALVGPQTTVSNFWGATSVQQITPGRYAEIFGQKRPAGRTVLLRQVQLLRKR